MQRPWEKQKERGKGCSPILGCIDRKSSKDKDRNREFEDQRIIAEKNRQAKNKQEDLRKHGKSVKQHIPGSGKDGRQ